MAIIEDPTTMDSSSFDRNPNFFKVYLSTMSSNRLKIPVAFMKHMKGETSGRVSLMGPSGNIWKVRLTKRTDGLFFEDGWPLFLNDHFIKNGDFFVFRYDKDLHFTVKIFDTSGCEKESAFSTINSQETTIIPIDEKGRKRESNDVVEVLSNTTKRKRIEIIDLSLYDDNELTSMNKWVKNQETISNRTLNSNKIVKVENSSYQTPRIRHTRQCALKYLSEKQNRHTGRKKLLNDIKKSDKRTKVITDGNCVNMTKARNQAQSRPGCFISQRRKVTEEELARAREAALKFKSRNPHMMIVMRFAYVYFGFYMTLPSSFRHKHLPTTSIEMTMWDPNGKAWPVRYVISKTGGAISAGWSALSTHNNIESGDVCVFELIKPNQMKVHIFRVLEETQPLIRNTRSHTQRGRMMKKEVE